MTVVRVRVQAGGRPTIRVKKLLNTRAICASYNHTQPHTQLSRLCMRLCVSDDCVVRVRVQAAGRPATPFLNNTRASKRASELDDCVVRVRVQAAGRPSTRAKKTAVLHNTRASERA